MHLRRTHQEIATIVDIRLIPEHVEAESPLIILEGNGFSLVEHHIPIKYEVVMRGESGREYVLQLDNDSNLARYEAMKNYGKVEVVYKRNLFGILSPDIEKVTLAD
ncbi:hypothetical protein COU54_03300 [Candidatus Pacearchaeota archaeon CG10_big_fil_rev_8_21_14_0_10_31_24]|nr:MAG: hypothetical protein COU54_03300 [Candidatus Pacearchaeota archaeon CG10_big_fil_rev_8_21_14_0_10_31_24]